MVLVVVLVVVFKGGYCTVYMYNMYMPHSCYGMHTAIYHMVLSLNSHKSSCNTVKYVKCMQNLQKGGVALLRPYLLRVIPCMLG